MQSSAQEVTMIFKLIAAAKDSWVCLSQPSPKPNKLNVLQFPSTQQPGYVSGHEITLIKYEIKCDRGAVS